MQGVVTDLRVEATSEIVYVHAFESTSGAHGLSERNGMSVREKNINMAKSTWPAGPHQFGSLKSHTHMALTELERNPGRVSR